MGRYQEGLGGYRRIGEWEDEAISGNHNPHPRIYEFRLGPGHTVVVFSPEPLTSSFVGQAGQPFIVWDSAVQKNPNGHLENWSTRTSGGR